DMQCVLVSFCCFFFFSSRRRHTRFSRDWSSDVCSSDLDHGEVRWQGSAITPETRMRFGYMPEQRGLYPKMKAHDQLKYMGRIHRSEERRVGKECRSRWSP